MFATLLDFRLAYNLHYIPVMKAAIPIWTGRVSPVFDVAKRLVVVALEGGREVSRAEVAIEEVGLLARTERITQLSVEVLICGAISIPLENMLMAAGVRVIPQMCGPVEEVLRAFVSGRLTDGTYLMPGCRGRRRRFRGRRCGGRRHFDSQEETV